MSASPTPLPNGAFGIVMRCKVTVISPNSEENCCKFTKYVQFILCYIRVNRCSSLYDDMTSVPYSLLGNLDAMIKRKRQSIAINLCVDSKTALRLVHFVNDIALSSVHFL